MLAAWCPLSRCWLSWTGFRRWAAAGFDLKGKVVVVSLLTSLIEAFVDSFQPAAGWDGNEAQDPVRMAAPVHLALCKCCCAYTARCYWCPVLLAHHFFVWEQLCYVGRTMTLYFSYR